MGFFDFLKRKRAETPEARRARLLSNGRITDGMIIESETAEDGSEIVQYSYCIHGVDFESSEVLTEEQIKESIKYAPGASVGVRFNPHNHGDSIIE